MQRVKRKPKIGAHVSTAGGLWKAFANAEAIGAETIQIFGSSPQTWAVRMPDKETTRKFREEQERTGVGPVFLHAAYLVNIASPNPVVFENSKRSLIGHLRIADMIGAQGLIFHPGSTKGESKDEALEREVSAMRAILKEVPGKTQLIMENTAGGGDKIGDLEDLKKMFKAVRSPRVKVCFDTAHAFEAGTIKEYTVKTVKRLVQDIDIAVGVENLVVIHTNDSKTSHDSHHDRHENLGEGHIGITGFRALAKERALRDKVWILEVPGFTGDGPDAKNIALLKSCF